MFIYKTTNIINGRYYIGMCGHKESGLYLGSGKILKAAIKKYGKKNFVREILQRCRTFKSLCRAEKQWIEKYDAVNDPKSYNITEGGFGGCSEYMKKYWSQFTDEEKKTVRNWGKPGKNHKSCGYRHSEETKRLIGSKSVNRDWGTKTPLYGEDNPNAKLYIVLVNGKEVYRGYLRGFTKIYNIPYSSLKGLARRGHFKGKNTSKYKEIIVLRSKE